MIRENSYQKIKNPNFDQSVPFTAIQKKRISVNTIDSELLDDEPIQRALRKSSSQGTLQKKLASIGHTSDAGAQANFDDHDDTSLLVQEYIIDVKNMKQFEGSA